MTDTTADDGARHFAKCAWVDCGRTRLVALEHCPHCGRAQPAPAPGPAASDPAPNDTAPVAAPPDQTAPTGEVPAAASALTAAWLPASLNLSVSFWAGVSLLALAAGFLFVRPRTGVAPTPVTAASAQIPAINPPVASASALTPQARASQMLQLVKLSSTPNVAFQSQSDVRIYVAPATVALSALYAGAQQGDHMDVTLYSNGQVVNRCNTNYLAALPSGSTWCQMQGVAPGDYTFHLMLNDVGVGDYPFTVVAAPSPSPVPPSSDAPGASRQQIAQYFADWSAPNNSGVAGLRRYYADPLNFYGSSLTLDALMVQKVRFAARWPVRSYVIRPDSVAVNCADDRHCTVTGLVDWDASSPDAGRHSAGVAKFTFTLQNGLIVAEGGSVVSRQ